MSTANVLAMLWDWHVRRDDRNFESNRGSAIAP